jgi:PIN domain nuclease of toxin-antitoxin system
MVEAALLDTHALLWYSVAPEALSDTARDFIRDRSKRIYVSSITAWELAIKLRLGKLPQAQVLHDHYHQRLAQYGFLELPFTGVHALAAGGLECEHKDPFDRALAAQAVSEQLPIVTRDGEVAALPGVSVVW